MMQIIDKAEEIAATCVAEFNFPPLPSFGISHSSLSLSFKLDDNYFIVWFTSISNVVFLFASFFIQEDLLRNASSVSVNYA